MKKMIATLVLAAYVILLSAQNVEVNPKLSQKLKLTSTDGANGCSVAYVSTTKKYYVAFAGNAGFPMEVFDEKGKSLQKLPCGEDIRGLWYNPVYNVLESNTFLNSDIVSFEINSSSGLIVQKDMPGLELSELEVLNSNAVFNLDTFENLYFHVDMDETDTGESFVLLDLFDAETGEYIFSQYLDVPVSHTQINSTASIYTGLKGAEYGVLDYKSKIIYLFPANFSDLSEIKPSKIIQLPKDAPTEPSFNFSYSNGHAWLFDKSTREWLGYKIAK
jgi:hypothetical protein